MGVRRQRAVGGGTVALFLPPGEKNVRKDFDQTGNEKDEDDKAGKSDATGSTAVREIRPPANTAGEDFFRRDELATGARCRSGGSQRWLACSACVTARGRKRRS